MIVETDSQLVALCSRLQHATEIFLDTEFVSEGRYYHDLGTIQIAGGDDVALIDPLAVCDLTPLLELLVAPGIVKVFHAASQDLMIFYRLLGRPVAPVFDTQLAAALLGIDEQISFANLVEHTTGEHLQKAHSFTDWLHRPLTPGQVEYALDDVRYLIPVYQEMVRELKKHGREEWAREEFRRLEDSARYAPANPRELYLRVRGVERMSGKTLSVLRELVAWREELARKRNIPVNKIARDEVLVELARRPRQRVKELREIRGFLPQQVDQFGESLISVLTRGAIEPCPTVKRHAQLPAPLEPTVDFLSLCLRSLAGAKAVSPGMVATRSDLAALIQAGDKADVPLMRGWRRQAVGEDLLATLQGRATARIIPENRQVKLEWHETPADHLS
ncbi:MAG TPA: ribonuclease D [Armatimonadota bacterium]|nr:ribonuclease D [Armatimonadota bacterium]